RPGNLSLGGSSQHQERRHVVASSGISSGGVLRSKKARSSSIEARTRRTPICERCAGAHKTPRQTPPHRRRPSLRIGGRRTASSVPPRSHPRNCVTTNEIGRYDVLNNPLGIEFISWLNS